MKESELAKYMVEHLVKDEWEVYQEVRLWRDAGIADIVAVRGIIHHIIECKTTLSMALIEQAWKWRDTAHFVSVCVPRANHGTKGRWFAQQVLKNYGIGYYEYDYNVSQRIAPKLVRNPHYIKHLKIAITPEHKTFCDAGSPRGGFWTPFKRTCRDLTLVVKENPGIRLKDAIDNLKEHHYNNDQSAYSSLRGWIGAGKVPGLYFGGEGRGLFLFYEKPTDG